MGCIIINTYCIMLQRYNTVKMNEYIKERKSRYERKEKELQIETNSYNDKKEIGKRKESLEELKNTILNGYQEREEKPKVLKYQR